MDEDYPAGPEIQQPLPELKQFMWLRMVHSEDWHLHLALYTPSAAHARNKWIK